MKRNVENVVYSDIWSGSATESALASAVTTTIGATFAASELMVATEDYVPIDTAVSIPTAFIVQGYDAVRGSREVGKVTKQNFVSINAKDYLAPLNYAQRITTFTTPVVGDILNIKIVLNDPRVLEKPLDFNTWHKMGSTTLATELAAFAAKINEGLTHTFNGVKQIQCYATATALIFVQARMMPDITGIFQGTIMTFKVFMESSYKASTDTWADYWTQNHANIVQVSGSVADSLWTGTGYSSATFTTTAANQGIGTPAEIKSHLKKTYGHRGAHNDTGRLNNQPSDALVTENCGCIVITYRDEVPDAGYGGYKSFEKQMTIYIKTGASGYTALLAFLQTIIASWQ